MKALIVGDGTGGLAAVRELGRAGWTVGVGSPGRLGWASVSRWTAHWHRIPAPSGDLETFIGAINQAVARHGYEVAFPAGDAELLALSASRDRLDVHLPYPPHERVLLAVDKERLGEVAGKAGLAMPAIRKASEEALRELGLPIVVKSKLHWNPDSAERQTRVDAKVAESRDEALGIADWMRSLGAEPLFQRFVPGELLAFVAFVDAGHRIVAHHARQTVYLRASEAGLSARAISVPVADDMVAKIQSLLTELRWFGLMAVQFQMPERGEPQLIDFNGRMDGAYVLAHACGMRAMDAWARLATGRTPLPTQTSSLTPRYQALEADLRRSWQQPGLGRLDELLSALQESAVAVHPIASWSDPLPCLAYLVRLAGRLVPG